MAHASLSRAWQDEWHLPSSVPHLEACIALLSNVSDMQVLSSHLRLTLPRETELSLKFLPGKPAEALAMPKPVEWETWQHIN